MWSREDVICMPATKAIIQKCSPDIQHLLLVHGNNGYRNMPLLHHTYIAHLVLFLCFPVYEQYFDKNVYISFLIMYIKLENENKRKYTSPLTLLNSSTFRFRSSKSAFIFKSSIIFWTFESSSFTFLSLTSIGFFLMTLAICSITCSIQAIPSVEPYSKNYLINRFLLQEQKNCERWEQRWLFMFTIPNVIC